MVPSTFNLARYIDATQLYVVKAHQRRIFPSGCSAIDKTPPLALIHDGFRVGSTVQFAFNLTIRLAATQLHIVKNHTTSILPSDKTFISFTVPLKVGVKVVSTAHRGCSLVKYEL